MKAYFIFCSILVYALQGYAQPKHSVFSKYQADITKYKEGRPKGYLIDSTDIYYRYDVASLLHYAVMFDPSGHTRSSVVGGVYHFHPLLLINYCNFIDSDMLPYLQDQLYLDSGAIIYNCRFDEGINISNVIANGDRGYLSLRYNYADDAFFDVSSFRSLEIMDNEFTREVRLYSIEAPEFTFELNRFTATYDRDFSITNSKFSNNAYIAGNFPDYTNFTGDTFGGSLYLSYSLKNVDIETNQADYYDTSMKWPKLILFEKCYIDAECNFIGDDSLCATKLAFSNCTFANRASMFDVRMDTLILRNCTDIQGQLFLTAYSAKKPVCIEIVNSNVTNLRFDYSDKFKLFFEDDVSDETKSNTYLSLIAKYKAEGKPESLEKIDIEYRKFDYKKHWYKYPLWLLDFAWWYYGYWKGLVIVWTLALLLLFFIYNKRNWQGMNKVYSGFDEGDGKHLQQSPKLHLRAGIVKGQQQENINLISPLPHFPKNADAGATEKKPLVRIMVFTLLVFFSLRMELEKLKYTQNKYVVAFIIQYAVGIICLFFLANAIFKLG